MPALHWTLDSRVTGRNNASEAIRAVFVRGLSIHARMCYKAPAQENQLTPFSPPFPRRLKI
jgi:hypothetical protein